MASRKEVARLAGVSEATVSRVLNGVGPMKEETKERVLKAAAELGYHVNALAASFARGRSGNLGVVLPHVPKVRLFSTFYFSEILGGIGDAAHEAGCGLLLLYRNPQEPYDYVSLFRSQRIDGCIVLGASSRAAELEGISRMAGEGLPFCLVDQTMENADGVSVVSAAHEQGSAAVVRHLLDKGCRSIGFLNGSRYYSPSRDRLNGYLGALAEKGLPADETIQYEGNYSMTSGYEAAEAIAADAASGKLDSLFAANDRMAIGAIKGLRERGLRIPEDLPVAGYDDSDASRISDPPLTTVRVPFYEMGRLAALRLLERMPDWQAHEHSIFREILAAELIVRRSTM